MIKKLCKRVAVASMVAVASIALITGCVKKEEPIKKNQIAVEQDVTGGNEQKINEKEVVVGGGQNQTPQAPTQIQNTGDPIKDEASWPIGKFGYHEPPEELRKYTILGDTYDDLYRIRVHDSKYGDIDIEFDESNGKRA